MTNEMNENENIHDFVERKIFYLIRGTFKKSYVRTSTPPPLTKKGNADLPPKSYII